MDLNLPLTTYNIAYYDLLYKTYTNIANNNLHIYDILKMRKVLIYHHANMPHA